MAGQMDLERARDDRAARLPDRSSSGIPIFPEFQGIRPLQRTLSLALYLVCFKPVFHDLWWDVCLMTSSGISSSRVVSLSALDPQLRTRWA